MTREEMIEQLENTILLIKQNGKDWWDERDIPILKEAIKAMQTECKKGKWVLIHPLQDDDGGAYACSECHSGDYGCEKNKYCRWCGAEMKEVEDGNK